jgi:ATP-binding cassette subfamily F protein uup
MNAPLLLNVKDACVRYSEIPVFQDLSFNIHSGSRISLVGKNGAGKSTLMQIITGAKDLDAGERWVQNGLTIGYLEQDVQPIPGKTIFDFITDKLKQVYTPDEAMLHEYKVEMITEALELDPSARMERLSGGQLRRTGLAQALVVEPDLLLLDEPTNHLDLEAIEWLETMLKSYSGAFVCISHDRTFLSNITNKVFWLDRGRLRVSPQGFATFEDWSEMLLEQEERELHNRKKLVAQEVEWASRGVKARRKRNQARLENMKEMREKLKADISAYRRATAKVSLADTKDIDSTSKVVAEFHNVYKSFHEDGKETVILEKYNHRIRRGDRIGILGKNGSGKSTFLKLLIGELEADQGSIKRRKELEFSYFDQKRSDLKDDWSLWKTLAPEGGDYISVMGKQRHVCGYLKDFLFDPADAHLAVGSLSGGQKNRLMLAKILADPKSCLILDEPTNDLDMDTLDMLEEMLMRYTGTLIVVSHDRDFLDQTITQILAFEGNGHVESHIGGYSDYLEYKAGKGKSVADKPKPAPKIEKPVATSEPPKALPAKKLSYKLEYELEKLPETIESLETRKNALNVKLSDANFYKTDAAGFQAAVRELEDTNAALEKSETRWLELIALKEAI